MDYISWLIPPPPGPLQDTSIAGLHPDVLPLSMTYEDSGLATALLRGTALAVAREADTLLKPPGAAD